MIRESTDITTRCPTCGGQTLFVGSGGHLTCSWIECRNPSIGHAIERYKAIEAVLAQFVDNAGGYDKSLVGVAARAIKFPHYYDRDYVATELKRLESVGRLLLANPQLEELPRLPSAREAQALYSSSLVSDGENLKP